jgi:hypothetical protein
VKTSITSARTSPVPSLKTEQWSALDCVSTEQSIKVWSTQIAGEGTFAGRGCDRLHPNIQTIRNEQANATRQALMES